MRRGPVLTLMLALALGFAGPVTAQSDAAGPQILTLDQERLFNESRVAERISAEIERQTEALAAENRAIEAALEAEELQLTEMRPEMDVEAFRDLADAFDEKVQRIREEQDGKARELQRLRDEQRQSFLRQITPVLAALVQERGAVIVLDRRSVFLSADRIDITDEAIRRINAMFPAVDVPEEPDAPPAPTETAPSPTTAPSDELAD